MNHQERESDSPLSIRERALIPALEAISMRELSQLSVSEPLRATVAAFRRNVEAIIWVATLPYAIANAGASNSRYRQLLASERIKAEFLKDGFENEECRDKEATRCAREALETESEKALVERDTVNSLDFLFGHGLERGAQELLRQSVVLAWSAFEVLIGEIFRNVMNSQPHLTKQLMECEQTRRMFQLKAIPLDTLLESKFDLSCRMGDVLLELHPLDSAISAKIVFQVLLPSSPAFLDSDELRLLNQQRHLIVHRRCIVDDAYIRATGSDVQGGSELTFQTKDVVSAMRVVRDCGIKLISAVDILISTPTPSQ